MKALCRLAEERIDALGLKGRKADDDCLAFLCGAASALWSSDRATSSHPTGVCGLVSIRGQSAVRHIASLPE